MNEKYKGYDICRKTKILNHKNKISGHEWSTAEPMQGYRVYGGKMANRDFRSVEKAKEAIDFDIAVTTGHLAPEIISNEK